VKSIRLSLLVYFLGLLGVALGAASWLLYRTAYEQLVDKKESTEKLINARFKERIKEEKDRLDEELLYQAQKLAGLVRVQRDWTSIRALDAHVSSPARELPLFGIAAAATLPNGYVLSVLPVAQSFRFGPVWSEVYQKAFRSVLPEIKVDETELAHFEGQIPEFFQIDSAWGRSYASASLNGRVLALDMRTFAPDQFLASKYEDYTLNDGAQMRRVILKTPSARSIPFGPRGRNREPRKPGEPRKGPDVRSEELPLGPPLFIQCAYDIHHRHEIRQQLETARDEELTKLEQQTTESLAGLRTRLWLISGLTFLATALGSYLLVRRGLAPLQRLSVAVSRVSSRDFRLPLNPNKLPTELRPIADHLTVTLESLGRAFAREKQATADISHDLRTPLAALLTTIEIALRKPRSPEEYRELLQDCHTSGKQMHQAVERLLTLARLDAGVEHLRSRIIDAAELAEQCASVVRPLAEQHGLHLTVHRDGAVPLNADPDKLREILNNLLHNAVQYNRPDGSIDVTFARVNDHVELRVSDTGIGLAPEVQPRIFERFYRVDRSRGADGLNTGLGLSIVKEYVDLMGGTIRVESALAQGSTFTVRLPAGSVHGSHPAKIPLVEELV
jgi:heavy metal sensor kinase